MTPEDLGISLTQELVGSQVGRVVCSNSSKVSFIFDQGQVALVIQAMISETGDPILTYYTAITKS